jgi:hypothetical protein
VNDLVIEHDTVERAVNAVVDVVYQRGSKRDPDQLR